MELGGGPQEFPPILFFFKKIWREDSLAEPRKSGWWYGKTAQQKSRLAYFWFHPPLNANPIHRRICCDHGRIFDLSRDGSVNYLDVKTSQIPWVMF
jgi:hypothetical protein